MHFVSAISSIFVCYIFAWIDTLVEDTVFPLKRKESGQKPTALFFVSKIVTLIWVAESVSKFASLVLGLQSCTLEHFRKMNINLVQAKKRRYS